MKILWEWFVFFTVLAVLNISNVFAFENGNYNTPDTWSVSVTPGRFAYEGEGVGLTDESKLYVTLTTRLRLKSNEYDEDQDIYQYIRMHTDEVELGEGTVKVYAYGRLADDINGNSGKDWGDKYYYTQRDILNTEEGDDDMSGRFYYGYARFDNVLNHVTADLGRFYLEHLNSYHIDGADVNVELSDKVSVYAYGGRPVSYYYELDDDFVYGAGAVVQVMESATLAGEYTRLDAEDIEDDYYKIRFVQLVESGSFRVDYENLNSAGTVNAVADYEIAATGTIINVEYKGLVDKVDSDKTYLVNPLTYALLPQNKYNKYKGAVYQAFLEHFIAGASYETKVVDGDEDFDNRNYDRYHFNFDIDGLPHKDTYISVSADIWQIDSNNYSDDNEQVNFSIHIAQKLLETLDVWLGSSYDRYEYDYSEDQRKDSVRSYYVGGQYQPKANLSFMLDVSREETDFYDDTDSKLDTSYTAELWASLAF